MFTLNILVKMKHHSIKIGAQTMKEEYDIWAMEMEHYLEYIDKDVWKKFMRLKMKGRQEHLTYGPFQEHLRRFQNGRWQKKFGDHKDSYQVSEGLEKGMTYSNTTLNSWKAQVLKITLEVFERELTSTSKSSTSAQNVAFVSHSKTSTNKVKLGHTGAYSTYTPSTSSNNIVRKRSSLVTDEEERTEFYQDQGAGKKEQNQNCLLTMDDGVVNWGEHTVEEEETNHALMAISSNTEVSLCSKTCIDSYNKLKTLCDEQMNQLGEQEAKILAYTLAVKKLEAQIVTFQKQQLSLNEQLTFQANEIYAKDEKLKRYRRIGMKAVKEKEQLKKTVDSWKDSSKNLWKLVDSGMTSNSKVGLGYEIQSNKEVLSYEEEMNRSVFKCTAEDYINKPLYSRFTKTNSFKGVPHPLTGDYTPKPQEEIDDSLYIYCKKGPQKPEVSDSDDNSTEHSTFQSNDSEGSCGNTSEHSSESEVESISVPNEMSKSKSVITNEKVMSESKEVESSCAKHVKTPRQQMKNQGTSEVKGKNWNKMMERELGEGYSFIKKKCFVCGSLSHLIKDCDYYEKKMAREAEFKKQRVFNTGNRVAKPVWTNANRVNHANHFVPRPVQLNAVRKNVNSVRPNVNTGRVNVNSIRHNVKSVRINVNIGRSKQPVPTCNSNSFSPVRPQVNKFNQISHFSKSYSPVRRPIDRNTAKMSYFNAVKGNWGTTVKTTAGYNWRNSKLNSNCDSGPTFIRTMNAKGPQGRPKPEKAWCKKQTIVATSTIEAEYVAAASCRGQVLWIQNQMLDYGFTFMNTKIHINNESTICIVKNPVYQSKTKHIEIRHHFIRDSYEKKLIRVEKVHTDFNVADLLTKAFDEPRFHFLVVNIGMINP
ncbi:hypothetical protein Tco_1304408 [Tanacetum coccineum]